MTTDDTGLTVHRVPSGTMAHRVVAIVSEALSAGAQPADIAVLTRVASALLPVQTALTEAGVTHTAPLDPNVLQRTGVRTALAYLRLALDTDRLRRDDVLDTLNRPARKVKSAVTPLLPRGAKSSLGALEQVRDQLDSTHRERFADYLGDIRHLEAAITEGADTAKCLWLIRNRIGLGEAMDALDSSRTRPEGSSHGDDLDALEQLAALQSDPADFGAWLTERLRVPGESTGVTLSTVHRVKGMEWSQVVVFAANQGLFPHRLADDHEEERRVFHVALTRCRDAVHVIADEARPSPFVAELTSAGSEAGAGTHPELDGPGRPAAATTDVEVPPVAAHLDPDGQLVAAVGVDVVLTGGFAGRIVSLERGHVVTRVVDDGEVVAVRLPHGSRVTIDGISRVLVPPAPARGGEGPAGRSPSNRREVPTAGGRLALAEEEPDIDDALFQDLRDWRAKIAFDNGVPAYLVFHDRHLQVIAGRKPTTLRALAGCPGVGPAKLERYGDDLLDLVAAHVEA
ncbi:MAG: HRDC domain-containing protein [Nitriliruptoraceae bacterium]